MSDDWLLAASRPLHQLGQKLGIAEGAWVGREELTQIRLDDPLFERDRVFGLTLDTVALVTQVYGDAFHCRFKLGGLPVLTIDSHTNEDSIATYRDETRDSPTVELELVLDKSRLIENRLGSSAGARVLLYLHPEALERLLTSDLPRLEGLLWKPETTGKVILLVPGREIWLNGEHLAVVGRGRIEQWRDALPAGLADHSMSETWYAECRRRVRWQTEHIRHLTPRHWRVQGSSVPGDKIHNALRVHGVNTALLYTADQTTTDAAGQWVAIYESEGSKTVVGQGDPTQLLSEAAAKGSDDLQEFVNWAYEKPWASDRLRMTRKGISQALEDVVDAERVTRLLASAGNIKSALAWNWEAFMSEKIDKYHVQVKSLEDDVRTTIRSYTDQISGMIKGLSDTVLAAVGVVIGSFVAAFFKDPFKPTVFRIGMMGYAGYVLFFPLIYNMLNQWAAYRALSNGFRLRRERFEVVLFPERVDKIVGDQVRNAETRFRRWFWAAVIAYVVLILLALVASWLIPLNITGAMPSKGAGMTATPIATQ